MLSSKKIFITGTSRGIGLEFTRQFLKQGNTVFAVARSYDETTPLGGMQNEYGDRLVLIQADVTTEEGRSRIQDEIFGKTETLDLVINNAGIYLDRGVQMDEVSEDILIRSFQTNAVAPVLVTQTVLSLLHKGEAPRLVAITSLMGSIDDNGRGGTYAYRMSKVALNMFMKSFSRDFPHIISLTLHPGWVQTDMGGSDATTSVEEAVRGMIKVIEASTLKVSGNFYDADGDVCPW